MPGRPTSEFRRVWKVLGRHGLILGSDAALPSVSGLVAGAPIRGSWWGHPRSHAIFQVSEELAHHGDVLVAKLVSGKITYIHRKLWPAFLAVARSRARWQVRDLSREAFSLLRKVTREGRTGPGTSGPRSSSRPSREAVQELETRLLAHVRQVHTPTGAHAKVVESWDDWMKRTGTSAPPITPAEGVDRLERAVRALAAGTGGVPRLPWRRGAVA